MPALPGQSADYGRATLSWLLAPVGMVAMPAGWPGVATAVDRSPVNLGCSDSCRVGAAVWYGGWDLPLAAAPVGVAGPWAAAPGVGVLRRPAVFEAAGAHSALCGAIKFYGKLSVRTRRPGVRSTLTGFIMGEGFQDVNSISG